MTEASVAEKAPILYKYPASESAAREFLQSGWEIRFPPLSCPLYNSPADRQTRTVEASEIESLAKHPRGGNAQLPIRISNAIIRGDLSLNYVTFEREVIITDSEFTGNVDLSFASFQKAVCFRGCSFLQPTSFRGCYVRGDLELDLVRFAADADFRGSVISKNLRAQGAEFARARFDGAEIKGDAAFMSWDAKRVTRFRGSAEFSSAHMTGQADFRSAVFESDLICNLIQVDGGIFFTSDDRRVDGQEALSSGSTITQQTEFGGRVKFIGSQLVVKPISVGPSFTGMLNLTALS